MRQGIIKGISLSPTTTDFAPLLFAGQLEHGLETAARLEFAAVELSVRRVSDMDVHWLEQQLAERELAVSAIATGQAYLSDGACLAGGSEADRNEAVARLTEAIELAARLRADVIVGGIRGQLGGTGSQPAKQRRDAVQALQRCVAVAAAAGVTLLIEPINRYETNFINTAAEALDLLDEMNGENTKLLLDSFHMNIEEVNLDAALIATGSQLGYLHIVDSNRRAPGQGHIDFRRLLEVAGEIGYRGPAIAEILPLPDDATAAEQTASFWAEIAATDANAAKGEGP